MATKKFNQMSTKKLNALLTTANEEDKAAIEAVLAAREQTQEPATDGSQTTVVSFEDETPLNPEEEAALKAAEENGGLNPLYNGSKAAQEKKPKMTDEERKELSAALRENINHRCQVVPFNTVEWVEGVIAGVIDDKRSNKVLYAIKLDDGRRVVKVHDSNLLKVLEEVVEPVKRARKTKGAAEKLAMSPEMLEEEMSRAICNVGKLVEFEKSGTAENGESAENVSGRIMAVVLDKRSGCIMYRIQVIEPAEDGTLTATKTVHKVTTSEGLHIADGFDVMGMELNTKYQQRRKTRAERVVRTPHDRVLMCEEKWRKAGEQLEAAKAKLEAAKAELEAAKAELEAYLANQANNEAPEATEAEAPASEAAEAEVEPLA